MTSVLLTRRNLMRRATLVPLACLPIVSGCAETAAPYCADPELLGPGEAQMRKTLKYIEIASDSSTQCVGCQFFHAEKGGTCGHCEILNGSVNSAGVCTSWAK